MSPTEICSEDLIPSEAWLAGGESPDMSAERTYVARTIARTSLGEGEDPEERTRDEIWEDEDEGVEGMETRLKAMRFKPCERRAELHGRDWV